MNFQKILEQFLKNFLNYDYHTIEKPVDLKQLKGTTMD